MNRLYGYYHSTHKFFLSDEDALIRAVRGMIDAFMQESRTHVHDRACAHAPDRACAHAPSHANTHVHGHVDVRGRRARIHVYAVVYVHVHEVVGDVAAHQAMLGINAQRVMKGMYYIALLL